MSPFVLAAEPARLDAILDKGFILVGTTGDYIPFSSLDPRTGTFEGYDIDAARYLGESLGVEVRFVKTTWGTLESGILEGKYDVAMCGITRTLSRQKRVALTSSYMKVGKSAVVRVADKTRFVTLAEIDLPGVRIGVNPGGTNEKFVRTNIRQARIIVIPDNLGIPEKIAAGEVDVMITDNVEAVIIANTHAGLFAISPNQTFTKGEFGYMVPRDASALLNWLNLWIYQMKENGEFEKLEEKWIGK